MRYELRPLDKITPFYHGEIYGEIENHLSFTVYRVLGNV